MARRGARAALGAGHSERRVILQTGDRATVLRISRTGLALGGLAGLVAVALVVFGAAALVVDRLGAGEDRPGAALRSAYLDRIQVLTEERDAARAEAAAAQARHLAAVEGIAEREAAALRAEEALREMEAELALARARVERALEDREASEIAARAAAERAAALEAALAADPADPDRAATLAAVSEALEAEVVAREAAEGEASRLATELAAVTLELRVTERRQEQMVEELRASVAGASGSMERALREVAIDVEGAVARMRSEFSGTGGPLVPIGMSSRSYPGSEETVSRFDELMVEVDRMNLLRLALGRVPYAMPVKAPHRFTSGFGYRRDPKGGGRRMHAGVDFAAPQGTPIYATADGVVASARGEGGYGQTVRIRHEFGYETVYAHLSRIHVKPGQRVSRGERIGDMGRTGRATGVHLHYEVRKNEAPVNPMTYVEAARNVY